MFHRRGKRREPHGVRHGFYRYCSEAGLLQRASEHIGITQREQSRVFEAPQAIQHDDVQLPTTR
jgi:hypothetical protein